EDDNGYRYAVRWAAESDEQGTTADYLAKREAGEKDPFGWRPAETNGFKVSGRQDKQTSWLRYRHIKPYKEGAGEVEYIKDFMSYNAAADGQNWVGDLMLECEVEVAKAEGELILELSKGVDRFQARWQLDSGLCTLLRNGKELAAKETALKQPG